MSELRTLVELTLPEKTSLPAFTPPPRFGETTFANYELQHPSQREAVERLERFIREPIKQKDEGFRWPWQSALEPKGKGLYLDGGFGVGKTHLLAAAYDAFKGTKVYLSFSELVYAIGVLGKEKAKAELGSYDLYCIDEFELDDPGNTLIVKTFLSHVFSQGAKVITTSNTPPAAQGEGRFNAKDFKREIQSIAERFETHLIEGPDYRQRQTLAEFFSEKELLRLERTENAPEPKVHSDWDALISQLETLHPIRYGALLEQVGTLYVAGATPIEAQNDALRFVHFIDKLYNEKVGLRISGEIELEALFDPSYRDGAYAKKHYRCLSRLSELFREDAETLAEAAD